jgi:hypothetical protein
VACLALCLSELDLAGYQWKLAECAQYLVDNQMAYGTMTTSGVASLAILDWLQGRNWRRNRFIQKGMEWLAKNWDLTKNPKAREANGEGIENMDNPTCQYNYLYSIERDGMLVATDFIPGPGPQAHDWYDEEAEYLLKNQRDDGSWNGDVDDTCFAILFLRRATRPLEKVATVGTRK